MKKIMFLILLIFLTTSLSGCSQKDNISGPTIIIHYVKEYGRYIKLENNAVIQLDRAERIKISIKTNWSYEIESFMSAPKLPKVELQNKRQTYFLYLDNELIASDHPTKDPDEFKEQEFVTKTGLFKTNAEIYEYKYLNFRLTNKGSYMLQVEVNVKIDGVLKNYVSKFYFTIE